MKTTYIFLLTIMYALFAACEGDEPKGKKIMQIAGVYTGQAQVTCTEMQFRDSGDTTITYIDETISEQITVSIIDADKSIVSISRSSYSNQGCNSSYDIGSPYSEYTLDEDFSWSYSYTYDKVWNSRIQFDPDNQSLTAQMLEEDVFRSGGPDSQGNYYELLKKFTYKISASR